MSLPAARRLYLVRHGITTWNQTLRMQGQTDVPLAPEGEEQAQRIAGRLANLTPRPDAVWSSDLSRAAQTAEAIARPLGLAVRTLPQLRETGFGEWEGLTLEEIEARGDGELLANYRLDPFHHRPPGAESLGAVWERMLGALDTIRAESASQSRIVIVGHGGSLRALLCDALDAPITSQRRLFFENASLSVIEEKDLSDGMFRRVLLFNDTSHLPESAL